MLLPPLESLRFFEAAARHQSFARAAEELDVTPAETPSGEDKEAAAELPHSLRDHRPGRLRV